MKNLECDEHCNPLFDLRRVDHRVDRSTLEHAYSAAGRETLWVSSSLAVPSGIGARIFSMARGCGTLGC